MEFKELALVFEAMESKSSRLELTDDLANLFKKCSHEEYRKVVYLIQGVVAPSFKGIELGMAAKLAEQSISLVSGKSVSEISALFRKTGDLGDAAEQILSKRTQGSLAASVLSVNKVYENFYKIAVASGIGSQNTKIKLLAELLSNAKPQESKILVRFVIGSLRLGVGDSTLLDALSFVGKGDKSLRIELERAYNLSSDLGLVAETFLTRGIEEIKNFTPRPFYPIRPALAERLEDASAIIEKLGECIVEAKYDGFRLAIHKQDSRVEIYSRKQELVTHMFPDIVAAVKKQLTARELICEGEALAYDERTGRFLPFQATIQRKRKHGVEEKTKSLPLKMFLFEILCADGVDYTTVPYSQRRGALAKIVKKGDCIALAATIVAKTPKQLEDYFNECIEHGLEGIIAKDLNAPYTAGARKFAWIKLKKSYSQALSDTLDVVIIGYYYGKGKRTEFGLGGLLTAIYDDEHNRFRSIARIGTGFSEEQMSFLSSTLSKIAVKQKPANVDSLVDADVWVQPKIVVEVNADELTRSPMHTCALYGTDGLALRFPRLVKIRDDKSAEQATTEKEALELYELQKQKGL